jgi:uncharacterized protein (DUF58 family)
MARLTARGWGLVFVAGGGYIAARLLGTWELYLLSVAFGAAVLVSWLLVSYTARQLAVTRLITPERPLAGDPLRVSFRVDVAPALPGLQVRLVSAAGDLGESDEELEFDGLGPRATQAAAAGPFTARRGVHRLPPLLAEMEDPLGLACLRRRLGEAQEVVVYPRLAQLSSCLLFGGGGRRVGLSRRGRPSGGATEFRGIRPHAPGEPLDHIDWKATAKTGNLMLREMDDPSSGGVLVLLAGPAAHVAGELPDTNFELAVQTAGAVAGYALRAGRQTTLLRCEKDWQRLRLAPGAEGQRQLLEGLARVEPHAPMRLGPSLRSLLGGGPRQQRASLVVLVVLSLDRDLVRALAAERREGTPLAVLLVDGASFTPAAAAGVRGGAAARGAKVREASPPAASRALLLSLETAGVQTMELVRGDDLSVVLSAWTAQDSRTEAPA